MTLTFDRFEPEHFEEYRSWYDDPDLNRALGPLDQEWLDCVVGETDGCEYAVSKATELIAVVGVKFPTPEHMTYAITDLAVKPARHAQDCGVEIHAWHNTPAESGPDGAGPRNATRGA